MRKYLWITAASLVLLGCADDGTPKPTTTTRPKPNSNTTTDVDRTTVSKPAIGGGQTPATSATGAATDDSANAGADTTRPDNTAVNQRDRDEQAVVPTDQGNNQEDLNITADIRKRILQNKEMSIKGQNVKIVTLGGKVTLRGPVASAAEKRTIEQIAKDVAGTDKVTSELEVAPE